MHRILHYAAGRSRPPVGNLVNSFVEGEPGIRAALRQKVNWGRAAFIMAQLQGGGGGRSSRGVAPVPIITPKGQNPTKKDRERARKQEEAYERTSRLNSDVRSGRTTSVGGTPVSYGSPSYSKAAPKPKPKAQPVERVRARQGGGDIMALFDVLQPGHEAKKTTLEDLKTQGMNVDPVTEAKIKAQETAEKNKDRLQNFLKSLNKAKPGSEPALPEAFKHQGNNPSAKLKLHWDEDYIKSNLSDLTSPSSVNFAMNGILEQQFKDREDYFLSKNFDRSQQVKNVLKDAEQAAFKGDFDYLEKYMKDHPEFNIDPVAYGSEFGITPEQLWKEWEEQRGSLTPDQREDARYRLDMSMRHYQKIRRSYSSSNKYIKQFQKQYEKKYYDQIEFNKSRGGDHAKAAKAAGSPWEFRGGEERDEATTRLFDQVGANGPQTKEEVKQYKEDLRKKLGVKRLPSVKELLASAVINKQLDPSDEGEFNALYETLRNPAHPDTLAMYLGYAQTQNKNLKEDEILKIINDPIKSQYEANFKQAEKDKKQADTDDALSHDGFKDTLGDLWDIGKKTPLLVDTSGGKVHGSVSIEQAGENFANTPGLMWTLDKISRLGYGVAGAANAWYRMDKEPDKSWASKGTLNKIVQGVIDPVSYLTGKSWVDSVDEALSNPEEIAEPFKAAYNQVFRGSNLPGVDDDITPITFSQVIANNAATDGEDNVYDQEWYQHVAGFVGDVAFDPLSYVGVGVVGNVIKIPTKTVKGASALKTGKSIYDPAEVFIKGLNNPDVSPVAEKVWRTQQGVARLGDNLDGVSTVSDSALFGSKPSVVSPVGNLADEAVYLGSKKFNPADVFDLRVQASQVSNDIGNLHLLEEMGKITDKVRAPLPIQSDIRVNRVVAQNGSKPYLWTEQLIKSAEDAGYREVRFGKGPKAEEGSRLLREAEELENQAALRRVTGSDDTAARTWDEQAIQKRAAVDAMADDPKIKDVYRKTLTEKYVREGGALPTGWSPREALARAANVSAKDLPFTDQQIAEAFILGPAMQARQSSKIASEMRHASERIAQGRAGMQSDNPGVRARSQANLKEALGTLNAITISGALRHLDATYTLAREGRLFSDPGKAAKLEDYRSQVRGELASDRGDSYAGLANEGDSRLVDEAGLSDSAYEQYRDFDFLEADYGTFTDPNNFPGFSGREAQLTAVEQELTRQIDSLRLDKDGKITGLPDQIAHDVAQMIPSGLRKPGGAIDGDSLGKVFYFENDKTGEVFSLDPSKIQKGNGLEGGNWHIRYDVPKEHSHFAEIMRGAAEAEQRGAYVARSRERSQWRRSGQAPVEKTDRKIRRFVERNGDLRKSANDLDNLKSNFPIRPTAKNDSSEWARLHGEEGIKSRHELQQRALNPAHGDGAKGLYETLYSAGAPFAFRPARHNRIPINGKIPTDDQPSKLRLWANEQLKNDRAAVDSYMKEVASKVYDDLTNGNIPTAQINRLFAATWDRTIKIQQKQWKEGFKKAQAGDKLENVARADANRKQALTPEDKILIREKSFEDAIKAIVDDVVRNQKVRRNWGNERLTINEQAREAAREIKTEFRVRRRELEIKLLEAKDDAARADVQALLKHVEKNKKDLLTALEKSRVQAHETKKIMNNRIMEEHILQIDSMPVRMEEKAIQISFLGMKKNLQFTTGLFRGAEDAEKLVPKAATDNFANNYVRPSKQFNSQEALTFRAMWEGKTPVIIKAHLTRLAGRMGKISEANRITMMDAYRGRREYTGPQRSLIEGVEAELKELEDIFNGASDFYKFKDLKGTVSSLSTREIARFLPTEYKLNFKVLDQAIHQDGKVTIDGLMRALGTKNDLNDPYRFSWVMRIAADQARQTRAIHHVMRETFGVRIPVETSKRSVVLKLKDKGWQEIEELGGEHLFPPEAVNDMRLLLEFMKPDPSMGKFTDAFNKHKFVKAADVALGIWKQGVTIYNPGYYTRNGIGEIMSTWLAGHNGVSHYNKAYKVHKWLKAEDHDLAKLVEQWSVLKGRVPVDAVKNNQVLFTLKGGQKVTVEDVYKQYVNHGLKSTFANTDLDAGMRGLASEGLTDNAARKGLRHVNAKVHDAGEGFEDYLRMAHFIAAMEKSGIGSVYKAAEKAAAEVRKYHFDYTDFSNYEKAYMLRAFPFYKWTRRGAPLMMAHLFLTPGKMTAVPKAMDAMSGLGLDPVAALDTVIPGNLTDDPVLSTSDVHDDKNGHLPDYSGIAPTWVKDLFAYQLNPAADDEYGNFLRIQTPQIDGLNAMLNPSESALLPLLNPMIKMPVELLRNQQLDPDSPYQIMGGDYNAAIGMNPVESLIAYAARNLQPGAGFLAKLSKNGKLGPGGESSPLNMGHAKNGQYGEDYDTSRDVLSYLTGMGLYQGGKGGGDIPEASPPAVGYQDLSELPQFSGRQTGSESDGPDPEELIKSVIEAYSQSGSGKGWRNFGGGKWRNFGWRNFNGFGNGGGYSSGGSRSSGNIDLWELLKRLERSVDQGQVIDE